MTYDDLAAAIAANKYNPGNIYWDSLKLMEDNLGGVVIQNATSPMATLLAHSVIMAVMNNEEVAKLERMESPEYSSNFDELSRFIPYQKLNLIHAIPAVIPVTLYLGLEDLLTYGVSDNNTRKVIVPKDTTITHNDGITYGFHHDLMITVTDGSVVDAVYQDNTNPLVNLLSPVIKVGRYNRRGETGDVEGTLLSFNIDMYQFDKTSVIYPVTKSGGFSRILDLPDQYYHARVYTRRGNDWIELRTAFSDFNYDPNDSIPTAVIKHLGTSIEVAIPYIYITKGLVTSEIKVELYTTRGEISVNYTKSNAEDFTIAFKNRSPDIEMYVSPLRTFKASAALSSANQSGGRNLPDFNEMRSLVASINTNSETITEAQLRTQLTRLGYGFIHHSNYLSENVYLASKALGVMSSDGASVMSLGGSLPTLLRDLSDIHGHYHNGNNHTITPKAIVTLENSQVSLLTEAEAIVFKSLSDAELIDKTNANMYLSPLFHHVFELNDVSNQLHIYRLDAPILESRNFIGVNPNAVGTISVNGVGVTKVDTGYTLVIDASATAVYQGMSSSAWVCQLVVTGYNGVRVSLNHSSVIRDSDGNYKFVFDLTTLYDLQDGRGIKFTNLTSIYGDQTHISLNPTLSVGFVLVDNLPVGTGTTWHSIVDESKLPSDFQVVSLEDITLKLGTQLQSLHRPIRTMAGSTTYLSHSVDVLEYYDEDVAETDEDGYVKFTDNPDYDSALPIGADNQ
jgi:hypothetical protein